MLLHQIPIKLPILSLYVINKQETEKRKLIASLMIDSWNPQDWMPLQQAHNEVFYNLSQHEADCWERILANLQTYNRSS